MNRFLAAFFALLLILHVAAENGGLRFSPELAKRMLHQSDELDVYSVNIFWNDADVY
jgi:hypothetical protein